MKTQRNLFSLTVGLTLALGLGGLSACGGGNSSGSSTQPPLPDGTYTRIAAINGNFDPNHAQTLDVKPGDVISLSAAVINAQAGQYSDQDDTTTKFAWSADDSASDICHPADGDECIDNSNFEITEYGVNYYVPYTVSEKITIRVQDSNGQYDTITLRNSLYGSGYVAPNTVITDAGDYHYSTFDASLALAGQGRFVYIEGVRYWVPYADSDDWQPYSNGYWSWVDGDGWTWVSYDGWGWYTDHYGYWRHHATYGWVWQEFDDRAYRPCAVTWMNDDEHIGWYPYYDGYARGYRAGLEAGFDDGFWAGMSLGASFSGHAYHAGFNFVAYSDFGAENILSVSIRETSAENLYLSCYERHSVHVFPGGENLGHSREFMTGHSAKFPTTRVESRELGGHACRQPVAVHPLPEGAHAHISQDERLSRPVPIGAVVHHDGAGHISYSGHVSGHGVALPPQGLGHGHAGNAGPANGNGNGHEGNGGNNNHYPPAPPAPPANNGNPGHGGAGGNVPGGNHGNPPGGHNGGGGHVHH